jgi:hypothetical protein
MRDLRSVAISAVPILLTAAIVACASRPAHEEAGPPTPTVRGGEKVYAPTGAGQRLEPVVDPEFHMAAARRDYLAGLRGAASREIEKLAAFMSYEADRAVGERRRAIEESREELVKLGKEIGRGEVDSVERLDRSFAHARAALVP